MIMRLPTRRRFLATSGAAIATVAMPHVQGAHAAGKLTVGLWDHWVPGANATSTALIEECAAKEKVDVQIDYITTQGNKLLLTEHAEAQAKSGHDILTFRCWGPADHAKLLEPVDDVMEPLMRHPDSRRQPLSAALLQFPKRGCDHPVFRYRRDAQKHRLRPNLHGGESSFRAKSSTQSGLPY